jgi:MFS transporter, MHS family, proline/betaine transporter
VFLVSLSLCVYRQIGVTATVLLTLIRLLQGVSVGGELVGSILFLVESSPRHQRGLSGSLCLCSAVGGTVLGSVVGVILRSALSREAFLAWGWRLPFLLGIAVGGFALVLRTRLAEPAAYAHAAAPAHRHGRLGNPVVRAVREHGRAMAMVTGASLFWIAGVWVLTTWLPAYLETLAPRPTPGAYTITAVACALFVTGFPLVGLASDRWGRRPIMLAGTHLAWLCVHSTGP